MKNNVKMKKSSFVEGTFIATAAIIISKILGMFYVIPFYAMIGIQGSALYAYAYNIYVIFLDISSAGLPIAMSKVISEYNALSMMNAKVRAFHLGNQFMFFIAVGIFFLLMFNAPQIAFFLLGDLHGGNSLEDVALAIRCVSLAILIVPFLSITKGYLQGHHIIRITGISQVLEQCVRIAFILGGTYFVLYVLHGSVTLAVCVAVLGAFVGGSVAYLYLRYKMKGQEELFSCHSSKDKLTDKEIIKKILSYAFPFIVINIIGSCYNFIDMTLILRTMNFLKLEANDVEFITSAVTTWAPKINMIVTSIAMGMSTSFIPVMVTHYTLKNYKEVNKKFNQAIQILLFISLPMTVGISLLSKEIWTIFYGYNVYGSVILMLNIFTGLFINIYMITSSTLQGLNKFKMVYIVTILGFFSNALLDVPLMLLFYKIGIYPFLGAIVSSIIGYSLSILVSLWFLKKECKLDYKETFILVRKILFLTFLMAFVLTLVNLWVPVNYNSRLFCLIFVIIEAICGAILYFGLSLKMGILDKVFGKDILNKFIKKLTFGKLSI